MNVRPLIVCTSVMIALFLAPPAYAQRGADGAAAIPVPQIGELDLAAGTVSTATLENLLVAPPAQFADAGRHIVQLDGPITPEKRALLENVGVVLGDYLPAYAYVSKLRDTDPAQLAALDFVMWVGRFEQNWKIAPEIGWIQYATPERQALADAGEIAVVVTLFEGTHGEALAAIGEIEGTVIRDVYELAGNATVTATLPAANLARLAELDDVQFVEEAPEITLRNNSNRWIVQSNVLNVTPLYDAGLLGEEQIIGILDSRVNANHCSFSDTEPFGPTHRKIEAYNTWQGSEYHGTHVAGIAVGDAGTFSNTRGVAYMGRLVFNRIPSFNESAVYARLSLHHDQGARIHTNSWGNDNTTQYDGLCRGFDAFQYDFEESLCLLAVTNQSLLKNPENAKNLLAVGASRDTPSQHQHCSGGRGPTSDGRRKPEIYAPGCSTQSAYYSSSCSTTSATGTSMACPAVAGTAMLVRQYFTDGYYPSGAADVNDAFIPSGALVKATLLNSAVDMTGISGYPSNLEGWGRVLADNALYFPGDARTLIVRDLFNADGLSTDEVVEESIEVTGASETLRVTLVFVDPPATAGANFAAINDLDLEVVAPDSTLYRGNVFSSGRSVPGGSQDDRNNVEQVLIENPAVGTWTVRVNAFAVNEGTQGYALAITGEVSDGSDCIGDLDGDGQRGQSDLGVLLADWGCTGGDCSGDIDGDGDTDQADLGFLLSVFGQPCP